MGFFLFFYGSGIRSAVHFEQHVKTVLKAADEIQGALYQQDNLILWTHGLGKSNQIVIQFNVYNNGDRAEETQGVKPIFSTHHLDHRNDHRENERHCKNTSKDSAKYHIQDLPFVKIITLRRREYK